MSEQIRSVGVLSLLQSVNLALAFVLELCVLVALGYWGFQASGSWPVRVLLGVGAPLAVAVFWGVFLAPKATVPLAIPLNLGLKVLVFGLATWALFAAGRPALGWALAALFVLNQALLYVWRQ